MGLFHHLVEISTEKNYLDNMKLIWNTTCDAFYDTKSKIKKANKIELTLVSQKQTLNLSSHKKTTSREKGENFNSKLNGLSLIVS